MSYTAKVYNCFDRDFQKLLKKLKNFKKNNQDDEYPKITELDSKYPIIKGNIRVKIESVDNESILDYFFKLDCKTGKVYFIGKSDGRDAALKQLNSIVTEHGDDDIIRSVSLKSEEIVEKMFNIMKKENPTNFISRLKIKFKIGFNKLKDRHPIEELQYKFVDNVCASNSKFFNDYKGGAVRELHARFGIWEFQTLSSRAVGKKLRIPRTFDVKQDYSFRLFSDTSNDDWIKILDKLTKI